MPVTNEPALSATPSEPCFAPYPSPGPFRLPSSAHSPLKTARNARVEAAYSSLALAFPFPGAC